MGKKVTMQQIADHAGVSKYAVSKALSGQSGVSDDTRERIVKLATQLGYFMQQHPQPVPRNVSAVEGRKANTVVILMPNVRMQNRASTYWGRIVDGITGAIRENGLGMIIVTEHSPENFMQVLNPAGVLGIVGVGLVANSMLLEIRNLGVPFVLVDHEDEAVPSDSVFVNNFDATRQLTNYLIGHGHSNLQFVGDIHYSESFFERWLAFRTALEENGLPVNQHEGLLHGVGLTRLEHMTRISDQVQEMKRFGTLPTAFVCANDSIGISAILAVQKVGLRVPEDISVTGFDDIEDGLEVQPALTTVHVDKESLGARAVDMLLRRLSRPDVAREKLLLCGHVILRDSVSPIYEAQRMARG